MKKHLIIIGGVAAGAKTAAKARRQDENLKITIYTSDKHVSYSGCGLPYYISNTVKSNDELIIRTPQEFKEKQNIDIHTEQLVTRIDPDKKEISIKNLKTNEEYNDKYDYLMISTGAEPFVPPIEGRELKNVFTLRNVTDSIEIKKLIDSGSIKNAVIVGGGLIGLECAEAFKERGLNVTVIELAGQILPLLDTEMAEQVEKHCKEKGINIITGDGVKKITGNSKGIVDKVITGNHEIKTDLVLLSIGVRPNTKIAKEAGIELGVAGAIKVNKRMETNIPGIYSAGDCVESTNILTGEAVFTPLGSVANKQARVAAINMLGGHDEFYGVLGTVIVKVFDFNIAKVGLSEKEASDKGLDCLATTIKAKDKAGYYPGAKIITLKMIADKNTRRILGCQVIGEGIVDKRIDVMVTAITGGLTVDDLEQLDLAYSPPYSPAIDIVIVAAGKLVKDLSREPATKI